LAQLPSENSHDEWQYAPVSGTIEAINEVLASEPGLLNKSPEDKGIRTSFFHLYVIHVILEVGCVKSDCPIHWR
jgi:hypothetical protein